MTVNVSSLFLSFVHVTMFPNFLTKFLSCSITFSSSLCLWRYSDKSDNWWWAWKWWIVSSQSSEWCPAFSVSSEDRVKKVVPCIGIVVYDIPLPTLRILLICFLQILFHIFNVKRMELQNTVDLPIHLAWEVWYTFSLIDSFLFLMLIDFF